MSLAQHIQEQKTETIDIPEPKGHKRSPIWEDPRPDLKEDHEMWQRLLKLCCSMPDAERGYDLCGVLNGMRCGGTVLKKNERGRFVFRPLVDEKLGWEKEEDYNRLRDKYMKPYMTEIKALLSIINREFGGR